MAYEMLWESDENPIFIRSGHKKKKKLDKQKHKRIMKTKKRSKRANRRS